MWRERETAQTRRAFPEEPWRCWGSRGLESERAEVLRMFFRGCRPLKRWWGLGTEGLCPPKPTCWSPAPQWGDDWRWGLRRWWGLDEVTRAKPPGWDWCSYKKRGTIAPNQSARRGHRGDSVCGSGGVSPDICGAASQTAASGRISACYLSHFLWCLLQQHKWTKITGVLTYSQVNLLILSLSLYKLKIKFLPNLPV